MVGPFNDHFAVTKAQWRSIIDIKKTFESEFRNKAAAHWALDATEERKLYSWGMDVLAEHRGWESMIWFSYKKKGPEKTGWRRFKLEKFVRF